jgi:flavin-dependent dehydrogenase
MDPETIGDIFGKHVHVYYLDIPGIWHAAITPKREYITVSILSSGNSSRETSRSLRQKLDQFLNHDAITRKVTDRLPDDQAIADALERGMVLEPSCFCAPEMPYKDSVNPYGDRIAIIGDAAYSRLFKNGVESAFTTAEMAVKAALDHGVSREELKAHYHEPAARRFNDDNRYGRALFRIGGYSSRVRGMVDSHLRVAQTDSDNGRRLKDMYWSMSTAGKPYRDIFADVLHPGLLMEIGIASVRGVVPAYVRRR